MSGSRPRNTPATRKRSSGGFMLGMFVGVVVGLAVSLGIAFYLNKSPMPFLSAKPKQAEKSEAAAKPGAIAGLPGRKEVLLYPGGVGARRAGAAAELLLEAWQPDLLVMAGVAAAYIGIACLIVIEGADA